MRRSIFLSIVAIAAMLCSCVKEELFLPEEQLETSDEIATKSGVNSGLTADIFDIVFTPENNGAMNVATSGYEITNVAGKNKSVVFDDQVGRYVLHLNNELGATISDSFFQIPFTNFENKLKTAFTVECVLRVANDATIPGKEFKPLSWTFGAGGGFYFNADNAYFRFQLHNGSGYKAISYNKVVQKNIYHHVTATFDGKKLCYYLNGKSVASDTFTGTPSLPADGKKWIGIGCSPNDKSSGNFAFRGDIAIARMYGKALTSTEVESIYNDFTDSKNLTAAVVRTTTSTATVAWTIDSNKASHLTDTNPSSSNISFEEDIQRTYKVALYSDESCSGTPIIAWTLKGTELFNKSYPPRFCFSNLQPATTYYFKVIDTQSQRYSNPLEIKTAEAITGKVYTTAASAPIRGNLVKQSFDNFVYGGDLSTLASGYSRKDRLSLTTLQKASGDLSNLPTNSQYELVKASTEVSLFSTLKKLQSDLGMTDWCQTSATGGQGIAARPGYVKIGTTNNPAALVTPKLTGLPTTPSMVKISFDAAPFYSSDSKKIIVSVYDCKNAGCKVDEETSIISNYEIGQTKEFVLSSEPGEWKNYAIYLGGVTSSCRIAIGGGESTGNNRFLLDNIRIQYKKENAEIFGQIKDTEGNLVQGVWVNDGYSFSQTNEDGWYGFLINKDATHISYTKPKDRVIYTDGKHPNFWRKIEENRYQYNMTIGAKLTSLSKWDLIVMADPQIHQKTDSGDYAQCMARFNGAVAKDLRDYIKANYSSKAQMGIVLGDISWNSGKENAQKVRAALSAKNTSTYWYTVPGNHDWFPENESKNPSAEMYKEAFGPMMYSFDHGDVHVIGINNIQTNVTQGEKGETYRIGFSQAEYDWIKNDLDIAYDKGAGKNKCVILCCHAPFDNSAGNYRHRVDVLNLLSKFDNPLIFAGHTHSNYKVSGDKTNGVYEYSHAAAMGNLWRLKVCPDGTPAGYTIYSFEGNKVKNVLYKPIGYSISKRNMNVYRGGDNQGGTIIHSYGYKADSKYIYANVFLGNNEEQAKNNANKYTVTIKQEGCADKPMVYLNDDLWEKLDARARRTLNTKYINKEAIIMQQESKYMQKVDDDPDNTQRYVRNDIDWGYMYWAMEERTQKIKDRNEKDWPGAYNNPSYTTICRHMWAGTLTKPDKGFTIVVTTPYGKTYTCTEATKIGQGDTYNQINWGYYDTSIYNNPLK